MEGDSSMSLPAVFNAISIHSLRMEGDPSYSEIYDGYSISIHSLRMEGDTGRDFRIIVIVIFQSTPSAWRETDLDSYTQHLIDISIHSLRMEGDRGHIPA